MKFLHHFGRWIVGLVDIKIDSMMFHRNQAEMIDTNPTR